MLVPAGVQDQNVAVANIGAGTFNDLRRDHRPVMHLLRDIDHNTAIHQIIERQ
jgi:hypothetical protein